MSDKTKTPRQLLEEVNRTLSTPILTLTETFMLGGESAEDVPAPTKEMEPSPVSEPIADKPEDTSSVSSKLSDSIFKIRQIAISAMADITSVEDMKTEAYDTVSKVFALCNKGLVPSKEKQGNNNDGGSAE